LLNLHHAPFLQALKLASGVTDHLQRPLALRRASPTVLCASSTTGASTLGLQRRTNGYSLSHGRSQRYILLVMRLSSQRHVPQLRTPPSKPWPTIRSIKWSKDAPARMESGIFPPRA
jgi:hypothetical protein